MQSPLCDECGTRLYQAGERVRAGTYLRVDDESFHPVRIAAGGRLPASFDGHIALYRAAAAPCVCEMRHRDLISPSATVRRAPLPQATPAASAAAEHG